MHCCFGSPPAGVQQCLVLHTVIILMVLVGHAAAVNNGLAKVPQMGWVSNNPRILGQLLKLT